MLAITSKIVNLQLASDDGYPLLNFGRRGTPTWEPEDYDGPSGKGVYDPWARCQIKFRDCFAPSPDGKAGDKEYDEKMTLDGAFKRVAFERGVACGDCSASFVFLPLYFYLFLLHDDSTDYFDMWDSDSHNGPRRA